MKYWKIITDNIKESWLERGLVSGVDSQGRTIWIADAHRDGKRLVVRADQQLAAFVDLESTVRAAANCLD